MQFSFISCFLLPLHCASHGHSISAIMVAMIPLFKMIMHFIINSFNNNNNNIKTIYLEEACKCISLSYEDVISKWSV